LLSANDNNIGKNLSASNKDDFGLDVLLQLNNEIFPMENGYWTKIEAKIVAINEHIPHGIKYSAKRIVWDHRHERKIVEPYEFENAAQLLEDFWTDVERILLEDHR
jgi:hypothetical protein